jgi:iron-sulfur cluster assembly accessory protein
VKLPARAASPCNFCDAKQLLGIQVRGECTAGIAPANPRFICEIEKFAIIRLAPEERRMATTTTTPTTTTPTTAVDTKPLNFTSTAIAKVKEIMAQQNPVPAGLRVGVVGGGCSGFSYSMSFENGAGMMDKTFDFDGLKVYVDATSLMYLKGVNVDYIETLEGAGFKFDNPNVKSTCGCGSSFSV